MAPSGGEATRAAHWDRVYSRLGAEGVSWFEDTPTTSLELLDLVGAAPDRSLIDVGAGGSRLVDALLRRGFADLTLLDVSAEGLELTRQRLGGAAGRVRWVVADVVGWRPERRYDIWHDRAAFTTLSDPAERARYLDALRLAVAPGGHVLLAAYAEDGPRRCTGLAVCRYSAAELAAVLGPRFPAVTTRRVAHRTPDGAVHPLTWVAAHRDEIGGEE